METKQRRIRWTWSEFARLPDQGSRRAEVIDDELYVTPAPTPWHPRVVTRLIETLGPFVRERPRELALRQVDLADLAGCSQRFVHTVEQGKPTLQLEKLLDVLEVLGLGLRLVPGRGEIEAAPGSSRPPGTGSDPVSMP